MDESKRKKYELEIATLRDLVVYYNTISFPIIAERLQEAANCLEELYHEVQKNENETQTPADQPALS